MNIDDIYGSYNKIDSNVCQLYGFNNINSIAISLLDIEDYLNNTISNKKANNCTLVVTTNNVNNNVNYNINIENSQILVCIFNYRKDDNAKRWLHVLQNYFETVVIDSGNDHEEPEFKQFPNIFYSGLWNEMKKLASEKPYKYVLQICSDVEIDDYNMQLLISRLYNLLLVDNVGVWQPAANEKSRKNWTTLIDKNHKYTLPSVIEGWMHLIHKDIIDKIDYIDTNVNLYGYAIDLLTSVRAKELNKLLVIDNTLSVYNPAGTGYDSKKAFAQGDKYLRSIIGKGISSFTGKYTKLPCDHIDGLDYDITFVVPMRNRDDMRSHFEKNIEKTFTDYTYRIIYVNQNNLHLFRPGLLRNIGARFANSKYILFEDVDILHLRKLDIDKLYNLMNHHMRLFDTVSLITINNDDTYDITSSKLVEGTSGCLLFSYNDWQKYNGFSNLFRGWGVEDDAFNYYSQIRTYKLNIGHNTHPKNNNLHPDATNLNVLMFIKIRNRQINHQLDGWKLQTFTISKINVNNNIINVYVDDFGVVNDYVYKDLYSQYENIEI